MQERDYAPLSDQSLSLVQSLIDPRPTIDHRQAGSLLSDILIPRIPGSSNNAKVRERIMQPFKKNKNWHIKEHTFTAKTPDGDQKMTNIIITHNAGAPRKLMLACHHDSKITPTGFVGATDSAAPCAIMIDTALALTESLDKRLERMEAGQATGSVRSEEATLQLIFFDGEEAYHTWSHTDSIYGSKALAASWAKDYFTPVMPQKHLQKRRYASSYHVIRSIDSIDHMVLLDLLGTPHPRVPNYFDGTGWMHAELRRIESRLSASKFLFPRTHEQSYIELPPPNPDFARARGEEIVGGAGVERQLSFFPAQGQTWGGIEDDHLPFLANGVPVLHLIPSPFPSVWHHMSDDASALDYPTLHAWAMIMRVFVAEYLELDLVKKSRSRSDRETKDNRSSESLRKRVSEAIDEVLYGLVGRRIELVRL